MESLRRIGEIKVSFTRVLTFLSRNISFSFSPLAKELVRLHARNCNSGNQNHNQCNCNNHRDNTYLGCTIHSDGERLDWHWIKYLSEPMQLLQMIKTYHSVGNLFFVSAFLQISLLAHICVKSIFHQFYTQDDEQLASYFAANYYPRLFDTYEKPYTFCNSLTTICSFHLILRLKSLGKLVRSSVVNRNGYKEIEISQLNQFFFTLVLPVKEWVRMFSVGLMHSDVCRAVATTTTTTTTTTKRRLDERRTHLCDGLGRLSDLNLLATTSEKLYVNPINFEHCYKWFGFNIDERNHFGERFYALQSDCRADVWEFSWFIFFHTVGAFAVFTGALAVIVRSTLYELCFLTQEPNEASVFDCARKLPNLLCDPISLIKLIDVQVLIIVQLPYHIEVASAYVNLSTMVSRVRRVCEMLEDELHYCKFKTDAYLRNTIVLHEHEPSYASCSILTNKVLFAPVKSRFGCYTDISAKSRSQLNRRLEQGIYLAEIIQIEFRVMKRSLTSYLNVLVIGSGFIIAVSISALMRVESAEFRATLSLGLISCALPILFCFVLCIQIERWFSRLRLTLCKLMVNEGDYIETGVVKLILTQAIAYDETSDRAFNLIGQYPITPRTVGPYIAYLSSCMIIASKFM